MNRQRTISIIGCGWLGLPLAKTLIKNGYRVKGSTTNMSKLSVLRSFGIKPFLINLDPNFKGESHFLDSEILIVNFPPGKRENEPDFYEQQLHHLRKKVVRSTIEKIIFVSSTSVYPNIEKVVKEEDAIISASSRSGISLLDKEDIFRNTSEIESTIIRFGGLYGPNRNPANFFKNANSIPGGENPVNMIHLDDAISIILRILEGEYWNYTFNACSPLHPTKSEFYTQAALKAGLPPPNFEMTKTPYKIVSSQFLTTTLGYQFIH